MAKPELLLAVKITAEELALLRDAFTVHYAPAGPERATVLKDYGERVSAVLTNGSTGWNAREIDATPGLEIICVMGAGYENVDVGAARGRGIALSYGPNTNDACVADHAMGLLLAVIRGIPEADRRVRQGDWPRESVPPSLSGKRMGILGLGNIGAQIATRAAAFAMAVNYHNRRRRPDLPWQYVGSARELAVCSDVLMIACPGGEDTRHLVDRTVLTALGPGGFLVNIARGSVVDTVALIDALDNGDIAGAGLDTVEGEPAIPERLRASAKTVLTPHMAGRSPETRRAMIELAMRNLAAYFAGEPLATPIPAASRASPP